jgi:hypothetical protein
MDKGHRQRRMKLDERDIRPTPEPESMLLDPTDPEAEATADDTQLMECKVRSQENAIYRDDDSNRRHGPRE